MKYGSEVNAAPVPSSPVPAAVQSLDRVTAELHDRINGLTQRLEPILAPQPPASVGEQNAKLARHSLALQIDSNVQAINGAISRLEGLMNRLEI